MWCSVLNLKYVEHKNSDYFIENIYFSTNFAARGGRTNPMPPFSNAPDYLYQNTRRHISQIAICNQILISYLFCLSKASRVNFVSSTRFFFFV
jgi:hypothetical protein